MPIENVSGFATIRFAMKIRNDHDRKLQTLRLVNRHQTHYVRRLVHLAFAFAAANRFKLFDVMNKIANQVAGFLKLFRQTEKFFDVGNALRAIKIRGDYRQELG